MTRSTTGRRLLAVLAGLALVIGASVSTANADPLADQQSSATRAVAQKQTDVNASSAALIAANQAVTNAQTALTQAQTDLTAAQAASDRAKTNLTQASAANDVAAKQLADANQAYLKAVADEQAGQAAVDAQADAIGAYARSLYQDSLPLVSLASVLSAASVTQLSDRVQWTNTVLSTNQATLDALTTAQQALAKASAARAAANQVAQKAKQAAQTTVDAVTAAKQAADAATAHATSAEQAYATALASTVTAKNAAAQQLAQDQQELASAEKDLADINARMAAAAAAAEAAKKAGTTPDGGYSGVSSHGLIMPVNGPVTSGFGWRIHPVTHRSSFHDGVDYGAGCGTPIKAAAAGRVTFEGWYGAYGNRIELDHGYISGHYVQTAYNHLSSFVVAKGATVTQGQVIGYVGTTGLSTGCHLHLSLWVDGVPTDIRTWL